MNSSVRSLLRPIYSRARPIYVPIVTRSIFLRIGERLIRYGLAQSAERGPLIIIACMPKSGSTFVAKLLQSATGFPDRPVLSHAENQDINDTVVRALNGLGSVSQIHMVCTQDFVHLANSYDIRTVILERNLLDVVVSFAEFLCSEEIEHSYSGIGFLNTTQNFVSDRSVCDLPMSRRYDFIIDLALPWYLRFHVSWKKYSQSMSLQPFWLTYEEFFSDVPAQAGRLLEYCGVDEIVTEEIIPKEGTRRNVGRSGRGKELLSRDQIVKIENLVSHYPDYANELIKW